MTIPASLALLTFLVLVPTQQASATACEPSPEIRAELAKAANIAGDASDFDKNVGPLLILRQRHPHDLLVHELYQDAVQGYGIEGHLRKLTEEYQLLSMQHPDELMYDYLYARSLIGRNTPSAIQEITKLVVDHPDFAPGHRSLAEIYASPAFRNDEQDRVEQERFLQLCPGSTLQPRPGPLSKPSPLLDQAERLLAGNGDPDRIVAMARQGIRDDERRLQRIRPFDWYSLEYKRQSQRELQSKYWRMWSIEVRCDRRAGHPEKAAQVLAAMDQRAALLAGHSDPAYWGTLAVLARLYEEGNQGDSATQKLDSMRRYLAQHPDPRRAAEMEQLRKQFAER